MPVSQNLRLGLRFPHNLQRFTEHRHDHADAGLDPEPHQWGRSPRYSTATFIPILHLHGQLGLLPELHNEGRRYESRVDKPCLWLAAEGIRIVHDESLAEDPVFTKGRKLLSEADYVIFLGFSYLDKNVERLKLGENRKGNTAYRGTGVDVTTSEAKFHGRLFPGRPQTHMDQERIKIDTNVTSVMEYVRNNVELFRK